MMKKTTAYIFAASCFACGAAVSEETSGAAPPYSWVTVRDFETGTEGYEASSGVVAVTGENSFSGSFSLAVPAAFPGAVDVTKTGGIGDFEAVSFAVFIPDDWPKVECVFFVQEKDGLWWQSAPAAVRKPAPSAWSVLTFHIYRDMHPVNHSAPFQRYFARDIKLIGMRFLCRSPASGTILLDRIRARKLKPPPLAFDAIYCPASAFIYTPLSAELRLSRDFFNPFDPDEIDVSCRIAAPSGGEISQPCYFDQDYRREKGPDGRDWHIPQGPGVFRMRFSPFERGRYTFRFTARSDGESVESKTFAVNVGERPANASLPPVRIAADGMNFETFAGAPFYPVGHNVRSPTDPRCTMVLGWDPLPDRGFSAYEKYFSRMEQASENLAEIWMAAWWLGIEWNRRWKGYRGLGWYNLEHAWLLDRTLELAASRNLYVHLVVDNHGKYSSFCDPEWQYSPYNIANGGFLASPDLFFIDPRAFEFYKRKMRYIFARWGAFTNVMGVELISELDLTGSRHGSYKQPYVLEWHRRAVSFIRSVDAHRKLLTTHFSGDFHVIDPKIVMDDCIDYVVVDAYRGGVSPFPDLVRASAENLASYRKPFMITEYGGAWNGTCERGLEADLHSGLWAFWMTPAAGTPLLWWFDFIDRRDLYHHFTAFSRFIEGEDRRRAASYRSSYQQIGSGLDLMLYGDASSGWGWVYDRDEMTYLPPPDRRRLRENVALKIPSLSTGRYSIEIWDTYSGEMLERSTAAAPTGALSFTLPPFRTDVALKYRLAAPPDDEPADADTGRRSPYPQTSHPMSGERMTRQPRRND
ncbi:MAG TPA: hypothetical protein ENN09_00610 [Planctomycetes bacterium]|nr:hypothetical protein [Planctomycetota bacterium]